MIYLKNNTINLVFIPRNEFNKNAVVPSGDCTLTELTVTENGEYLPKDGFDGYCKVIVDVMGGDCPELEEEIEILKAANKELTTRNEELTGEIEEKDTEIEKLEGENDELTSKNEELTAENEWKSKLQTKGIGIVGSEHFVLTPDEDFYAMDRVDIFTSAKVAILNVTSNGMYQASDYDADGFAYVNVSIPTECEELVVVIQGLENEIEQKDEEIKTLTEDIDAAYARGIAEQKAKLTNITINTNGTYTREDGWNVVNVNVPLTTLDVTDNGVYRPLRGGGYSQVNVNVPSGWNGNSVCLEGASFDISDIALTSDPNSAYTYEFEFTNGYDKHQELSEDVMSFFPQMHFGDGYKVDGEWDGIRLGASKQSDGTYIAVTAGGTDHYKIMTEKTWPYYENLPRYDFKMVIVSKYVDSERCSLSYKLFCNDELIMSKSNQTVKCNQTPIVGGNNKFYFKSFKTYTGEGVSKTLDAYFIYDENTDKILDIRMDREEKYDITGAHSAAFI